MKNVKYIIATLILGIGLTSCGDSFLNRYPDGGVLIEDQYKNLPDRLQGSVRGIYSKLYEYGNHDTFGQRSIDMYGDIQSGDMAMKNSNYGWFESYERGYFYAYARGYIWSYFYEIIHLVNLCEIAVEKDRETIFADMASGTPSTDEISQSGYYYGQLLALRGYAYAGLLNYYCDPRDANTTGLDAEKVLPVYVGKDVAADTLGAPLSTIAEVYSRVYEDLSESIDLLDFYGQFNARESKLEINADVARIILAYAMLNHGDKTEEIAGGKNCYQIAQDLAEEVINGGKYPLLRYAELTTTGFADVNAGNWMWGEDVTVENTTALGSFFGQVDIHTYSYAAAGDTKGIDSNLFDQIKSWDGRKKWFRDGTQGNKSYCPDGKFYNPKTKHVTALSKVDRDWLCDNIFMRIEVAYLIAAEAAWNQGNYVAAKGHIEALCNERVEDTSNADYVAWVSALTDEASVKAALIYNWRIEMWGEGYGLQTLRRLSKQNELGSNHISRANKTIDIDGADRELCQCQIPSSETRYNPALSYNANKKDLQYKK